MERRDQYKREIRSSRGAAMLARMFLVRKRRGERVRSEARAVVKERVERVRPIMVRYWRCQP